MFLSLQVSNKKITVIHYSSGKTLSDTPKMLHFPITPIKHLPNIFWGILKDVVASETHNQLSFSVNETNKNIKKLNSCSFYTLDVLQMDVIWLEPPILGWTAVRVEHCGQCWWLPSPMGTINTELVHTCTEERAAGVVAALGLLGDLARSTVEMQMSGDPTGLNGHQVSPNSWEGDIRGQRSEVIGAEHSVWTKDKGVSQRLQPVDTSVGKLFLLHCIVLQIKSGSPSAASGKYFIAIIWVSWIQITPILPFSVYPKHQNMVFCQDDATLSLKPEQRCLECFFHAQLRTESFYTLIRGSSNKEQDLPANCYLCK